MTPADLAFADVSTLQRLLVKKTLSSLELTNAYLDRLERYGPTYNAVVTIVHERARAEAKRADRERGAGNVRGPLHGIPYGVKDCSRHAARRRRGVRSHIAGKSSTKMLRS